LAIARLNEQPMLDEVELDLEAAFAVWNRRSRQPARGDVERDVPRMIEPRRARQPDLADDLRHEVKRFVGIAPCRIRKIRPRV
jgi:hypothetical protein